MDTGQQGFGQQEAVVWDIPSFDESNGGFDLPDEGYYKFKFVSVGNPEPVAAQYDPEGKKRRALFTFQIQPKTNGDLDENIGMQVRKWFTISMNEKSALYPFVKAMLGGKIDPAQRINPHNLIGRTFMAVVSHETKDDGRVFPTIASPTVDKSSNVEESNAPF